LQSAGRVSPKRACPWLIAYCLVCAGAQCTVGQAPTETAPPAAPPHKAYPEHYSPLNADQAREYLHDQEAEHPGDSIEVAKALASVALLESAYEKSTDHTLEEAQRAVRMAEKVKGRESPDYAYTRAVEARVRGDMDRPDLARPIAEEALAIAQRTNPPADEYANILSVLAVVCGKQDDVECEIHAAQLQIDLARRTPEKPMFLVSALVSLALYQKREHDAAGMERSINEMFDLESKQAKLDDPLWITVENTANLYYSEKHDYEKAREHLLKGISLSVQQKGPDDLDQAVMVANLSFAEMCLGHFDAGLNGYWKAHDMYVRRFGPAHSRTAEIDYRYAETLHFLARDRESLEWALQAHRVKREYIRLAIRLMPERQALALSGQGMPSLGAAITIALAHPEFSTSDVYQEVVRSRALVAEEMAMRAASLNRERDPAIKDLEKALDADRRAVMNLQGAGNKSAEALSQATAQMEKDERDAAQRSAAIRTDERVRSSALADLLANLPRDSVLVSYQRYERIPTPPDGFNSGNHFSYAAFVLHPDGRPVTAYALGRQLEIAALVAQMRSSVDAEAHGSGLNSRRNEREYRQAGEQLRKRVWDPLLAEIAKAHTVFVVPDGVLNLVPFSALPAGEGYMVEHGPVVHLLTSERDLLPNPEAATKAGLLAIGSPAFELAQLNTPADGLRDAGVKCEAFNKMQFHALPGSLGEIRDISATWQRWNGRERTTVLTGDEATRSQFIEKAAQSRVLHVATHAFVLDQKCGNGNPLMHSGLVFAGANKTRDASVLTAQQIASLDLHGVDWAVLSACNSGYGELQDGEGVLGLERSFRVAGARSVIMALWPVDDEAARTFMRVLYAERFGKRQNTAESVWSASRKVLERRRAQAKNTHPWYWASFVGAGSWQ
jgi:CHAT domain-containing protein